MTNFRSTLVWIICFLFIQVLPSTTLAKETLPSIVKKIGASVVVILGYDKEGRTLSQGTGFFINENGDVITSRHVLKGVNHAEIKTADGQRHPIGKVIAENIDSDLIKISAVIHKKTVRPLLTSNTSPEVGEKVVVIGNPLGLEQTVSDGIVSAFRQVQKFGKIIQITAPISPGSSGSPVVNLAGEVIGVATFQMVKGQNLNFAIPIEQVVNLVQKNEQTLMEWEANRVKELLGSTPRVDVVRVTKIDGRIFVAVSIKNANIEEFPLISQAAAIHLKDNRAFSLSGLVAGSSSRMVLFHVKPGTKFPSTGANLEKGTRLTELNTKVGPFSTLKATRWTNQEIYLVLAFDVLNATERDIAYLRILNFPYVLIIYPFI